MLLARSLPLLVLALVGDVQARPAEGGTKAGVPAQVRAPGSEAPASVSSKTAPPAGAATARSEAPAPG
ncbi:hypothetical protein ACLEPN_20760, partial [Myxococcus sp. 1LA]